MSAKNSAVQMETRIEELKKIIFELQEQEQILRKAIAEEENDRNSKRKQFEEEGKKMFEMKAYLEEFLVNKKKSSSSILPSDINLIFGNIKQRLAAEEEKLRKIKEQYEVYKKDIAEVKCRRDTLKVNHRHRHHHHYHYQI